MPVSVRLPAFQHRVEGRPVLFIVSASFPGADGAVVREFGWLGPGEGPAWVLLWGTGSGLTLLDLLEVSGLPRWLCRQALAAVPDPEREFAVLSVMDS